MPTQGAQLPIADKQTVSFDVYWWHEHRRVVMEYEPPKWHGGKKPAGTLLTRMEVPREVMLLWPDLREHNKERLVQAIEKKFQAETGLNLGGTQLRTRLDEAGKKASVDMGTVDYKPGRMRFGACPKCRGAVRVYGGYEPTCVMCGWADYGVRA